MAQFKTYTARLVRSTSLSEWTRHLEFEMQGVTNFGFVPGQWLSVKHILANGEELIRPYSMASAPTENGSFAFCLNRVSEGHMSNFLCDMQPGAEISCQGPFGNFILHPPPRDTVFIATGTGIAPIRSMLHWLLADQARHLDKQFWLLFGSRTKRDIYYHDEFVELAAKHANFHYMPTLSRGSDGWPGLRGYVQEHVKEVVGERKDMHAYICGLAKMVKANRDLLSGMGWDRKSILYERYD
ncbi:MAG TPA: FAD-dependent oxidoreductase [Terriglobales bacterium]